MNVTLLITALIGYVLGSIPMAWIALRLHSGRDIRNEGTGNIGAHNTFDVTGAKWLAVAVGIADAAKGCAAILIVRFLHGDWFAALAVAGTAAIVGHCYSVLMRFKGGRGLATAVGVFAVVAPFFLLLWGVTYLTGYYVIRRHIYVGAVTATIATAALAWSTPDGVLTTASIFPIYDADQMRYFVAACSFVIFLKHIEPLRELLRSDPPATDDE